MPPFQIRRKDLLILASMLCLAVFAAAPPARAGAPPRVVAISPLAGARWIRPGTSILVRYDRPVALEAADLAAAFTVTGSVSGPHAGRAHFGREHDALLFDPDVPFTPGEHVTVSLSAAATPDPGRAGPTRTFGYDVTAHVPEVHRLASEFMGLPPLGVSLAPPRAWTPPVRSETDSLPADFPALNTQVLGTTSDGALFLSNFPLSGSGTPYLIIADESGQVLWYKAMVQLTTDFRRQDNGMLSYCDTRLGAYVVMDSTLHTVDSWQPTNGYLIDDHELQLLPNGHALFIADDWETVDMSQVVAGGDTAATVMGIVIQELDADRNVVFEWRSWDHFALTDCIGQNLTAPFVDYVHSNAIVVDTDGNLLLSSRHLCEITKIDRTTGDVIWRWGGRHNQFTFLGDTTQFSYQHGIRRLPNGDCILFDNGDMRGPPWSRAAEYALDESLHTATLVWSYRHDPDIYSWAMGLAQRLDNGNTLVSYGTGKPDAIEVAPDGTEVFELSLPANMSSYRIFRQRWNPVLADVAIASEPLDLAILGANPARGATVAMARLPRAGRVAIRLYDLQGRLVATPLSPTQRGAGVVSVPLPLTGRESGVYFCRLETEHGSLTRRVVFVR